ncbi:CG12783, partial [Drosophila busckii]
MMVINETMSMSYITIVSQCDFATNSMDKAIMSAASFIGNFTKNVSYQESRVLTFFTGIFFSSYIWGYLSDSIGRRPILIYTTFTGNILSLVSIFIPNYWIYVVVRFFVGFFIAGASSTTYAYLGEFYTPKHRPVVINYASMFVGVSAVYVPAVAWLVMSMDWSFEIIDGFLFRPWRLLTIFYMLPGLLGTLMLLNLPESPKFLLAKGKTDDAFAAVNWISMKNTGKELHEFKVKMLLVQETAEDENALIIKKMWMETLPLFKKPHLLNFSISCTIMCGLFFSSSGMGLWYPEILNRLGSSDIEDATTVCEVIDASIDQSHLNSTISACSDEINTKSYIDTITYGSSLIVGYIIMGFVLNHIGRKSAITGGLAIAASCALLLVWMKDEIAIVVCFCLYLVLPSLCISVLSGAVVDLVPTHLRGKAVCICLMVGRTGSVFGSNIIGVLLESYCILTFGVFSGFVLCKIIHENYCCL